MDIEKEEHDKLFSVADMIAKKLHIRATKKFKKDGTKIISKHYVYMFMKSGYSFSQLPWQDKKDIFQKARPEGCSISIGMNTMDVVLIPGFTVFLELK